MLALRRRGGRAPLTVMLSLNPRNDRRLSPRGLGNLRVAPGAGFTTACAPKASGSVGELVKLKPIYDKKKTTTVYATRRRPVHFISRPT